MVSLLNLVAITEICAEVAQILSKFEVKDEQMSAGQGLVKGAKLCSRNPYFYFRHGESTSTASQLTSPASQKSKDLDKVLLFLQDLGAGTL